MQMPAERTTRMNSKTLMGTSLFTSAKQPRCSALFPDKNEARRIAANIARSLVLLN
jgi:hypothetical protein